MEAVKKFLEDVKRLKPYDILSWKKPAVSGAVLGLILALWWIFVYYNYTLTTFSSRLIAILLLIGAAGAMTNKTVSTFSNGQESVDVVYEKLRPFFAKAAESLYAVSTWKNPVLSLKVLLLTYITAFIGNYLSDTTVFLLIVLAAFGIPPVYERKKEEADEIIKKFQNYTDKYIGMIATKGKEAAQEVERATEDVKKKKQ